MVRLASLGLALLAAPAAAFHDSSLEAGLKATPDWMMQADPARA